MATEYAKKLVGKFFLEYRTIALPWIASGETNNIHDY
ncbi:hypothetical protein O206_12470 [Ochrobactrum sp. EGD-AQ16]|nr:hypothetical protein O206_12470 [Ochrobactrum sp. EGD-AQ16]